MAASSWDSAAGAEVESCFTTVLMQVLRDYNGRPAPITDIFAKLHLSAKINLHYPPTHVAKEGADSIVLQRLQNPTPKKSKLSQILRIFGLVVALVAISSRPYKRRTGRRSSASHRSLGAAVDRSALIKERILSFAVGPVLTSALAVDRFYAKYPVFTSRNISTLLTATLCHTLHEYASDRMYGALAKCIAALKATVLGPKPPEW